jgi:hypothetical protein
MSKRTTITNRQRSALRTQHKLKPHLTGLQIKKWFEEEYNQKITPPSISRILSAKYDWLDTADEHQLNAKRQRTESWPELEGALYEWIKRANTQVAISQEVIRKKARQFWPSLYPKTDMPQFSNGWLQRFQSRRNIRINPRQREADSLSTDADEKMISIRQIIDKYLSKDIFNCDETGLCWKLIPDQSRIHSVPGEKKNQARMSLHFCTNSDGSERLPVWIIGTAERQRVFQATGINIENLGCYWRHNEKAWMTGKIFEEWLCWFDRRMAGRNVLLLMDNFSAHESAFKKVSSRLQNTLVVWLPENSTAKYQPLAKGIIPTWKAYWKRQWLFHMKTEFDRGYDPIVTMTILKAIRWAVKAWEVDLSHEVIQNCFTKTLAGQDDAEMVDKILLRDIQASLNQLAVSNIKEVMTIDEFLNPAEEEVTDKLMNMDNITQSLFGAESNDEAHDVLPKVSVTDALEALYKLRLFEEQQADGNQPLLKELLHYERVLLEKRMQNQYPADIRPISS